MNLAVHLTLRPRLASPSDGRNTVFGPIRNLPGLARTRLRRRGDGVWRPEPPEPDGTLDLDDVAYLAARLRRQVEEGVARRFDLLGPSARMAYGVELKDGTCVLRWCCPGRPVADCVYDSAADLVEVEAHGGLAVVSQMVWTDEVAD